VREDGEKNFERILEVLKKLGTVIHRAQRELVCKVVEALMERSDLHVDHKDHAKLRHSFFRHGTISVRLSADLVRSVEFGKFLPHDLGDIS